MYPLIEIKTVPIEIEMKTTPAQLKYTRASAEVEISRNKGGLSIKSRPIRVKLDTFEARNSITPTAMRSIQQSAQRGQQAAYEATATYARNGKIFMNAKIGEEKITQLAQESQMRDYKANVNIQFLPSVGPEISWDVGEMNIRYQMDKLNFDWKLNGGNFEFVPGDIEFSVTQMPDVIIKYVGGPIYVPPSSDPNYEPEVDTEA
ncbi:MAG TPA: hypothetical protein H9666_02680 [Firmicutes bacterium]|nr:hypothetical protein [Bacillota bacterium]